jgi:nicotinate-nucleotide adenylyltransferase
MEKSKDCVTEISTIALFGTSADPPTAGHQSILIWLSQRFDRVAVWAANNPYKEKQTPLPERMEMLRLSIEAIKLTKCNVRLHPELSDRRTLNTVERARQLWGDQVELTLVIGSDLVEQICHWYRIEELFQKVKLLIIPRPNYSILASNLQSIKDLGGRWSIANLDTPNVSSSDYRSTVNLDAIPPSVAEYIRQKKLYSSRP